jgi:flagellar biosynthesis protein FlhB
MSDQAQRTIPATPRRREAARQQGMMPLSTLPAWLAAVVTAVALGPSWAAATLPAAVEMVRDAIQSAGHVREAGHRAATDITLNAILPVRLLVPTVAVVLVSGGVGLAVRVLLDGVAWRPARILPVAQRIDPLAGIARILSPRTAAAVAGNGLALVIVVTAAAWAVGPLVVDGHSAGRGIDIVADPLPLLVRGQRAIIGLAAVAAVVAAAQWAAVRWRFERRIRMTPQEFQDEARSLQADPKVKLMREQMRRSATAPRSPAPDSRSDR